MQRHQGELASKYGTRIDIMLVIAVVASFQRRMAEPEMVSACNRAVTPGEMVGETLPTPHDLLLIDNALIVQ